jgi:Domain of unknown function (DUF1707)
LLPVLLVLVYPHHPAGPIQALQQRASDADRDIAVDILCAAVGDARLTLAELDQRVGAALSARTHAELAALIADLPGRPSPSPAGRPSPSPALDLELEPEPVEGLANRSRGGARLHHRGPAARSAAPTPTRWSLIQSLVA